MKIYFRTFGCKTNQYDTELIREKLNVPGVSTTLRYEDADLCIVNSCSVTSQADKECRQFVRRILRAAPSHARIVVTGCYATRSPEELQRISPRIETYSNAEKNNLPSCFGYEINHSENYGIRQFGVRSRAFVKVQDGCRAPCRYCIIPSVRPQLWSKPFPNVMEEIRGLINSGYQEIVLTGIRLGLYRGLDASSKPFNLVDLLKRLIQIPGYFRIRLSSIEVTEVTEKLLKLMEDEPKICRHLHIPLQSGDSSVLQSMGRWYTRDEYIKRVMAVRSRMPECGLTCDVMVGYPTEAEMAFQNTVDLIESIPMSGLHVFPYSPRPGTKSFALPSLSPHVIHKRVQKLLLIDKKIKEDFRLRFQSTFREVLGEPSGMGWTDNYLRISGLSKKGLHSVQI